MQFQIFNWGAFGRFLDRRKSKTQERSNVQSVIIKLDEIPKDRTNTVLSRLISDEAMIVNLIKHDILASILLRNSNLCNTDFDLANKFELNRIVYDLLLLDKAKNKDETIEFYDKIVENTSKMLLEFPKASVEDLALNCYIEVKHKRKW